jgi:hypothetical protein
MNVNVTADGARSRDNSSSAAAEQQLHSLATATAETVKSVTNSPITVGTDAGATATAQKSEVQQRILHTIKPVHIPVYSYFTSKQQCASSA